MLRVKGPKIGVLDAEVDVVGGERSEEDGAGFEDGLGLLGELLVREEDINTDVNIDEPVLETDLVLDAETVLPGNSCKVESVTLLDTCLIPGHTDTTFY